MVVSIPMFLFAFFWDYQAIRRMLWEHRNGGIWRRSQSDLLAWGIGLGLVVVILVVLRLAAP